MENIPDDVWRIIIEYFTFSDYKSLLLLNKIFKNIVLSIDYHNDDFRHMVIINKSLFKDNINFNIVILNKILSFDCKLISTAIKNNFKIDNYKLKNLLGLIMIIKLGRGLINSTSYLSENIYGNTIYYWMTTRYQEMINELDLIKNKLDNLGFLKLREENII